MGVRITNRPLSSVGAITQLQTHPARNPKATSGQSSQPWICVLSHFLQYPKIYEIDELGSVLKQPDRNTLADMKKMRR